MGGIRSSYSATQCGWWYGKPHDMESLRVQWALKRKAAKDLRQEAMQKFQAADALDREADALASLL